MKCEIIAHRGFSAIAPENTIAAFNMARLKGANGIEFDIQLSKDHHPIIIHDYTIDRTTQNKGEVAKLTLKKLKELDVGSWFNDKFKGEKIPTLTEVLNLFSTDSFILYIEVKKSNRWQDIDLDNLIKILKSYPYQNSIYIISFDFDFLHRLRKKNSLIKIGYNVKTEADYYKVLELSNHHHVNYISSEYHLLLNNNSLIQKAHDKNIKVAGWTVDDIVTMEKLKHLNIQTIMTNKLIDN